MWQDLFFASNSIIFSLMLIPQLVDAYHGKGMNITTASLTAGILFLQCYAYFTLNMFLAAIPITAIIWAAIAYYSVTRKPRWTEAGTDGLPTGPWGVINRKS